MKRLLCKIVLLFALHFSKYFHYPQLLYFGISSHRVQAKKKKIATMQFRFEI